jgi:hypothetical protein
MFTSLRFDLTLGKITHHAPQGKVFLSGIKEIRHSKAPFA